MSAFPISPTDGQTVTINGVTYVYSSSLGVWNTQGSVSLLGPVTSVAGHTGVVTLTAADIGSGTWPGAMTASSTLTVSGLLTANGGLTVNGGALTINSTITASGAGGFASATYQVGARNPIWRFGNADGYGLSYFQGSAGNNSQDTIGLHFGTATTAGSQFQFNQNGTLTISGSLGVGTAGSGTVGELRCANAITAYYSDERLKNKIGKIENALDKIDQLSGFLYVENDIAKKYGFNNNEVQVALSAQDVKRVQPEAVKPAPFDITQDGLSKSGENYLTVQYERLVPLIVEGIKELRQELNIIKQQLKG